jgi:hypothetical protein
MSSANTTGQEQSANEDKSVFMEQGCAKITSRINNYNTDTSNNSANVENLNHGRGTGESANKDQNKAKSSK